MRYFWPLAKEPYQIYVQFHVTVYMYLFQNTLLLQNYKRWKYDCKFVILINHYLLIRVHVRIHCFWSVVMVCNYVYSTLL